MTNTNPHSELPPERHIEILRAWGTLTSVWAADEIQSLQLENERLNDWLLQTQMLAHKWMEAHDKRAAGKPYNLPKPADLPDALAEIERLREGLSEAIDVFAGISEDVIDLELIPRLRTLLGDS